MGGERPLHFLAIFGSETGPDDIEALIRHVFTPNEPFDPKTGAPRTTGGSIEEFLRKFHEFCRPSRGDRHLRFVLLPAHADSDSGIWQEMRGSLRQWAIARMDWHGFETPHSFSELPQGFQELILSWAAAKRGEDWEKLGKEQKERYRTQGHWPLVNSSDPALYKEIGARYTWLKMEVPDVEGIRLALLDPESRLRHMADGPPGQRHPRIERLRVRGTDFFEDVEIPFNPGLTTLIGGRGSGKSTAIEYLRYVFDRARGEDFPGEELQEIRKNVDAILGRKGSRDYGETPGTLLPDHEIKVDVVVAERRYRIRRTSAGFEVVRDPDSSTAERLSSFEVRALLAPRILSQHQISRIVKDPTAQRNELDALIERDRLRAWEESQRQVLDRLTHLQATRARLKERRKALPAREMDLRTLNDQIAFFESSGGREILARFAAFQEERRWLKEIFDEVERLAESWETQVSMVERSIQFVSEPPSGTANEEWLGSVAVRLRERLGQTVSIFRQEAASLREYIASLRHEQEYHWSPRFEEAKGDYERLCEELKARGIESVQYERFLQQRAFLEREIRELQGLGEEIERLEGEIYKMREGLLQLHADRTKLRREQAKRLEELDADVRLEVHEFRDQMDFQVRREEWFSGTGMNERDWDILVEYVFAPEGSVPERLAALVAALRTDVERTFAEGRPLEKSTSAVVTLLGPDRGERLTGHFFRALQRAERIELDKMERFLPEDEIVMRVRGADGMFKPVATGSVGERSTAVLSLLLSAGDQPLIIDQPEDDLDNRYVYDVVVDLLRRRKFSRQIIIATHNANIPVNGDAELIVALGVKDRLGMVLEAGSIDRREVKDQVSLVMEGSAEAFRLRRERYGF
ncbi:MAG: hypothetical protein K6U03_04425 [Firmicutes bacterium]|nr:hypothetical protein [Bacillota bacterium]